MAEPKPRNLPLGLFLPRLGLSEPTAVAAVAVSAGAREVLNIHGRNPSALRIEYKLRDGSPVTIADLRSSKIGKAIALRALPGSRINDEETGIIRGGGGLYSIDFDPNDGTYGFARGQRYSTVGMGIRRSRSQYAEFAAVVHPFERELFVAEKGKGTLLLRLEENMRVKRYEGPQYVSDRQTLKGGMVYLDATYTPFNRGPKNALWNRLLDLSEDDLHQGATGSSLDHSRQVAAGRAELVVIDAVGGPWDLIGGLLITESKGKFVDALTGRHVTRRTQVAIGGVPAIVDKVLPITQLIYQDYKGYNK
jgi:fructose-1,6-bisphosphatase/inositol monophosphatase family enzyme